MAHSARARGRLNNPTTRLELGRLRLDVSNTGHWRLLHIGKKTGFPVKEAMCSSRQ